MARASGGRNGKIRDVKETRTSFLVFHVFSNYEYGKGGEHIK